MTDSDDLVAFLRARLNEHRNAAKEIRTHVDAADMAHTADYTNRIIREVYAKRALVDLLHRSLPGECDCEAYGHHGEAEQGLRLLALLYADHPDYRQEWKP